MLKFMLDTDMVSYALRGEGRVGARLIDHRPSEICLSAITVAELRYGADLRASRKLHGLIDSFLRDLQVVAFDGKAANRYGALASSLSLKGTPIGLPDTLIAAHALSLSLTLVTNNERHFGRVPGLETENWR